MTSSGFNGIVESIPLLCTLCPKTPRFSDISHLLTHISSKSHLSHQFKIQVRSKSDPTAQDKLNTFNEWFERYGIEGLLSNRIAAKEANKSNTMKGRPQPQSGSSIWLSSHSKDEPTGPNLLQIPSCLRPNPSNPSIKAENHAYVPRIH